MAAERAGAPCPRILGIDEHFFSRKQGYATTFCDLKHDSVYDLVPGRSEATLEGYLRKLKGKGEVQVVCMDLSATYRSIVRKYLPNAPIVADRFHVIRLINHHFLACWKEIDPLGAKNRGLLSLMRRHRDNLSPEQAAKLSAYFETYPVLEVIYRFKQRLCYLLLKKHKTHKQCEKLAPRLLRAIAQLKESNLYGMVTLGETLDSWRDEIASMWRFTRNNGITEGFRTRMEVLQRQAYGIRNFENYRLRVKVLRPLGQRTTEVCPHKLRRVNGIDDLKFGSPSMRRRRHGGKNKERCDNDLLRCGMRRRTLAKASATSSGRARYAACSRHSRLKRKGAS